MARRGPLWVVLGDATGQAPTSAGGGYVERVLERLWDNDPTWQVVNLSRRRATTADVLDEQLPRFEQLARPALVSCNVGTSEVRRRWARGVEGRLRDIGWHLPAGSVVATVAHGVRDRRAAEVNGVIHQIADHHALVVADVWARTAPGVGESSGGDRGTRPWVDAFLAALELGPSGP